MLLFIDSIKNMYISNNKVLLIIATYKNTNYYLPGTLVDKEKIYSYFKNKNYKIILLEEEEITFNNIKTSIKEEKPNIIWITGHGFLNKDKKNEFILPNIKKYGYDSQKSKITDEDFGKMLEEVIDYNMLIILDICNSATFINLKYYYEKMFFLEKISDKEYQPFKDEKLLIICISASKDKDFTFETEDGGGFLTDRLLNLFKFYDNINFEMLDSIKRDSNSNVIISTSKIQNIFKYFISFENVY